MGSFEFSTVTIEPDYNFEFDTEAAEDIMTTTTDSFDPVVRDDNGDDEPSASSARSKVKSRVRNEHNQGFLAGVAIGAAAGALVLLAILGMALYRKFWCKSLHSINFDNPVYRKSAEEAVNLERDPSSVSMTSTVTTSNMSASSSVVVGAKRSYTSNTLATDVSEGIVLRDPLISLA